jgi:ech hydrogenase subunit A
MVAPTPVSALLHSSTMVKAGVYILVRFSPLFMNTRLGYGISLIGGFTFLAGSALAIGQRNAKKVLAYSTISNLGLIVTTAGIGTSFAITAAIMLMIFHAVSKGLLFLCVGTIEHGISSRDIEDMDGLITKMPLVGILTSIGMASMLLPPFGIIITKLLGIEAASKFPLVLLFIVGGSAFTVVFWIKWMGKILTISKDDKRLEKHSLYTVIPLSAIAILVIVVSVGIIQINSILIAPYILDNWGHPADINFKSMMLIPIFISVLCLVSLIPIMMKKSRKFDIKSPYLCGENTCVDSEFRTSEDASERLVIGNYYLEDYFNEKKLTIFLNMLAIALIFFMFGVTL